jgi:cell wall-associated NlpC family hydrolase
VSFPRPCSAEEAVERALRYVGHGTYALGAGAWTPGELADNPWTRKNGFDDASDCWGYISWALKLPRHVPGFNKGPWATVSDDANTDSAIEDAEHLKQMFIIAPRPEPGDLLVFPSVRDVETKKRIRIGHVGIIVDSSRCLEWDPAAPAYDRLEVVQCQASTRPAVKKGSGAGWLYRDTFRGRKNPAWWSRVLRPVR